MKTIAVIPCYDEEKFIAGIVTMTRKYVDCVVVADDWSSDKTVYVAQKAGAMVVSSSIRKGYGGNIRFGIDNALANEKPDIIVLLDGDGQHNPNEIPSLIKPVATGVADITVGNRILKIQMPKYRRFGNSILNLIVNIGASHKISDSTCGFRAIRGDALKYFSLKEKHFGIALEMVIKARAQGMKIVSVPISCVYHNTFEDNSSMNPLAMGLSLLWVVVKWRVKAELFKRAGR